VQGTLSFGPGERRTVAEVAAALRLGARLRAGNSRGAGRWRQDAGVSVLPADADARGIFLEHVVRRQQCLPAAVSALELRHVLALAIAALGAAGSRARSDASGERTLAQANPRLKGPLRTHVRIRMWLVVAI